MRITDVVGQAHPPQLREVGGRQIPRSPAGDPGVQRDHDSGVAGRLGPMHQTLGELTVGRGIQLEKPWGRTEFGRDILQRIHRQRRYTHRHAGAGGRPGSGKVAVVIWCAHTDHADRRHEDRDVPAAAPQFDGHIALGGADEHPRHQSPVGEGGGIGALGQFVTGAACDIGPDRRRHRLFGAGRKLIEGHGEGGQHTTQPLEVNLDLVIAVTHDAFSRSRSATTSATARSCPRSELVGMRWISLVPMAAKPRSTSAS